MDMEIKININKNARYFIGVDMGGTKLAAGIVNGGGEIVSHADIPTGEPDAGAIAARTAGLITRLLDETGVGLDEVGVIGVGVPGTANRETGMIEYANNLGMEDVPFAELLDAYFPQTAVVIENDANAAAYAEYKFGAGVGCGSMVMVTLGTGIGAGIILNGALYEGVNYAAGELGHTVLFPDGLECNCGRRGCFERYASASALIEQARRAMREDGSEGGERSLLWELCGGDESRMNGKLFFAAARRGDRTALDVLDKYACYLAAGLTDIVNLLEPELIVIGGGISREGKFLLAPVRRVIDAENYARASRRRTELRAASLGNDAGMIGAAFLPLSRI